MLIGLGTGRCGTGSLAKILGVPHENIWLPWKKDPIRFRSVWQKLRRANGDVGTYWLPYVEDVLEREPETRFICLRRNRAATCKSWERLHQWSDRFRVEAAWRTPEGKIEVFNVMPDSEKPVPEAVRDYYDSYYRESERLLEKYPNRFRIFESPLVLTDRKAQRKMLRFCGLKQPVKRPRVHTSGSSERARIHKIVHGQAMEAFKRGERKIFIPQEIIDEYGIDAARQMVTVKIQ